MPPQKDAKGIKKFPAHYIQLQPHLVGVMATFLYHLGLWFFFLESSFPPSHEVWQKPHWRLRFKAEGLQAWEIRADVDLRLRATRRTIKAQRSTSLYM